jgi:predicted transposase YbfD/YdcC
MEILLLTLCAVLSGAEDWVSIVEWGEMKLDWLREFLPFKQGIPSHDVLGDVFAALDAEKFEQCFREWIQSLCPALAGKIVAVDGKTVRGSGASGKGRRAIHMVSAFASESGLLLGQLKTAEKSNEITAIPELLSALDVNEAIVTIDAIGCQKAIVEKIVAGGGDYVLAVKSNQPKLFEAVVDFFDEGMRYGFGGTPCAFHETVEKDHGRIETRRCWAFGKVDWLLPEQQWKKLSMVGMIESVRDINGETSTERRYYIGSIPAEASRFGHAVRNHWGVENKLHWQLDVSFREDDCRARRGNSAQNLSTIRRIALQLLRQDTSRKIGIRNSRLKAGWSDDYRAKVLGLH